MALPPTLTVEIDSGRSPGNSNDSYIDRFEKWKGSRFLKGVLVAAGITQGHFVYRLGEWFKSSGFTKPVQPRKYDNAGIALWLKPGGNGSAVKGTLYVDKEHYSPEMVFAALKKYVQDQDKKRAHDAEARPDQIDDATTELLLLAVNSAHERYVKNRAAFDEIVTTELRNNSFEVDDDTLAGMVRAVAARGFLDDTGVLPGITVPGQTWLDDPKRGLPVDQPVTPPTPAVPKTTIELIEAHRAKLTRLLEIPDLVRQSRTKQKTLEGQIADLMKQLEAEHAVEAGLLVEIPDDAVRLLLEP